MILCVSKQATSCNIFSIHVLITSQCIRAVVGKKYRAKSMTATGLTHGHCIQSINLSTRKICNEQEEKRHYFSILNAPFQAV